MQQHKDGVSGTGEDGQERTLPVEANEADDGGLPQVQGLFGLLAAPKMHRPHQLPRRRHRRCTQPHPDQ